MTQNSFDEQLSPSEGAADLMAISDTLMSLSRIIGNAPDEPQIQAFADSIDALGDEALGCSRMQSYFAQHADEPMSSIAQELGVDWTLAFRGVNPGKGPKPPYAGAWLAEDGVGVEIMMEINSHYVKKGLGASGERFNRMDYLAVELEFVSYLLKEASDAPSDEERAVLAHDAAQFTSEYILTWLPRYRESVESTCKTEFWKGYLELLEAVFSDVRDLCEQQIA